MPSPDCLQSSEDIFNVRTKAPGPDGSIPIDEEMLKNSPSGDIFAYSQNAGMGWDANQLLRDNVLILSTMGGFRHADGTALALGYHTGHWELGLLVKKAAETIKETGGLPFAAYCSDPCDGRTQGTNGMMDSLAYRNSGAEVLGRLIRSLPTRKGLVGIATCDKGLPAMMMALAEAGKYPGIMIPGGVTLPPVDGEDAGAVQSLGARYSHGEITLEEAARLGCSACASPGGGCQFLGTAASSQVICEALGMSLPHSALSPSGEPVWLELAYRSSLAIHTLIKEKISMNRILTPSAIKNAMSVHAAVGGSTNLLLHLPAIAFHAGLERPKVEEWIDINRRVPRIVDVLPNGPQNFKTVQLFLAGGVPEIMLHLRDLDLLDLSCLTASGQSLGQNLEWWEQSERRQRFKEILDKKDGVDPDDVIMTPSKAKQKGLTSTVIFPKGNLMPQGSVVKSTAIDEALCPNGIYYKRGIARVFNTEIDAIKAMKETGDNRLHENNIIVLNCRGPIGAGMPETAQITIALKYTKALKNIALLTDGRFSGFTSGPCIGHIGPEALAGGPIGKIHDGDVIEIHLDRNKLTGSINLIGESSGDENQWNSNTGDALLQQRPLRSDLKPDPDLPNAVRLWAALQQVGGGTWGGCVYDPDAIIHQLENHKP